MTGAVRRQATWRLAPADDAACASLAAGLGLSEITSRVLVARGAGDIDTAKRMLEPSLGRDWHAPEVIPGMEEAASRVSRAVRDRERILVFGDFDLDGISAAAVAARGLAALGGDVTAIVPHRFREGYGLTEAALERVFAAAPALVITVDCGISSAVEVRSILERGVDVVVTDHHEPGEGVPQGVPVANPKLEPDCPSRNLAGAGVALKLVQATGAMLGRPDEWESLVDLASLGTIADVVELTGENRALVAAGVRSMREAPRVCLSALCAVAAASPAALTSDTVAYALAPRLNAAGRIGDPQVALDLLLTDDPARAEDAARSLDEYNRIRQSVEADLTSAAESLAARVYGGERGLVLAGEGWHEGVKGIVASRLAQSFGVPTILFSVEDGVARGSGRSVGNVDLFKVVESCSSMLVRFGGHEAAVGVTLAESDLERFREAFLARLDTLSPESFDVSIDIDAEVPLDQLSVELGAELALLEPFGHGNRRPLLASRGVFMNGREKVGKAGTHLKFIAYDGVASVPAIAFRCPDIDRLAAEDASVDLAFELSVDEWRGRRRAQVIVRDVVVRQPAGPASESVSELIEEVFSHADEILAREEYAGISEAPSFHTKLAGVTFEGRQDRLGRLAPGTPLRLERQPENPHDANACALYDPHGDQIGFLNRRLAGALAPAIDAGVEYDVEVTEVTGGAEGRSLGVNVLVMRRDASVEAELDDERRRDRRAELSRLSPDELDAELVRGLLGDRALHPAQAEALDALAMGRSSLVVMATGRGKSLIFHLHAARVGLRETGASVFVYPLRALVADQAYHLSESFAEVGLSVRVVTGETAQGERDTAFAQLKAGELDTVLTTPEFLYFHSARFAETGRVRFVVVDEAHHVGLARAGNRPAYAKLGEAIASMGAPTTLAVTATASDDVASRIRKTLSIDNVVLDPTVRDNLIIEDGRETTDKDAYLKRIVERGDKVVVYVNSRDASVRLARMLRKRVPDAAWKTAFYNGGLSRSVRHAVERAFRSGDIRVVIATSAFGEGVNIPDIRHVLLYHLPFNEVEFNQMSGRAGRDGAASHVHLLFGQKDARINERILSSLAPSRDDLGALYRVLRDLAESEHGSFEITNAELAERARSRSRTCGLDDRGVSSGLGVFRELGLITGEGHGAYRRIAVIPDARKVDLESSVRYAEGQDEIEEFAAFKRWALESEPDELLARFNRPILPSHV